MGKSYFESPESKLEQLVSSWAKAAGFLSIKMRLIGSIGFPDRLFVGQEGRIFFVEFKRLGEKPRPVQEYWHRKLRERGVTVYVVDNYETGIYYLQGELDSQGIPVAGNTNDDAASGSGTISRPRSGEN